MTILQSASRSIVWLFFTTLSFSLQADEKVPEPETSVNVGYNLTRGNQDSSLLEVGAEAFRPMGKHRLRLSTSYAYGETKTNKGDITTRDTSSAKIRHDLDLQNPWIFYNEADLLRDQVASIDYRLTVGPGLGRTMIHTDPFNLQLEVGTAWLAEKVEDKSNGDLAARAGQSLEWSLSEAATLKQSVDYLVRMDDENSEIINARVTLESSLTDRLNLRLDLKNRYESDPAEGKDSNDLTFTTGIAVKL
jgi:putative salt-induced outer membrane protein YdiY